MARMVVAETRQGRLRGKKVTAVGGNEYYSFQGIPYAKPPVGPLRFKPPEPAAAWDGLRDATSPGESAASVDFISREFKGDEDGLFLNVYTPQWPPGEPKPVMFWIHGGGFFSGSGNTDTYGPDYLVAEDVILVTINYRLGVLGFLNLEGSDVTANNGLRDQVMALKWVRDNIEKFGGDPANVTIFGESAGGVSVHCLMLSPLAEGLFHRAIAQSGTALLQVCYIAHDVSNQRALRFAKALGCTSDEPQQVADFLKTVPVKELVTNQMKALSEEEAKRVLANPFSPTTEKGRNRFFPDHPAKLLEKGKFAKVPFITGMTSADGILTLIGGGTIRLTELGNDFQYLVPWDLATELNTERSRQIADRLKQFYFGEKPLNESTLSLFIDMHTDLLFLHPVQTCLKHSLSHSSSPVYVYLFDHVTSPALRTFPVPPNLPQGAFHSDDEMYLFRRHLRPIELPKGSPEEKVKSNMVTIWTQFAKTGNLSGLPGNVTWPPVTEDNPVYLRIGETLKVEKNLFKERAEFMEILYNTFKRVTG